MLHSKYNIIIFRNAPENELEKYFDIQDMPENVKAIGIFLNG
jgi:hypothetical protein